MGKHGNFFVRNSLENRLIQKKKLYTCSMNDSMDLKKYVSDFNKIILYL